MRTPRLSRQSISPRLILSLTLALSLLFATASSVLADGHEGTLPASGGTIEFASGVSIKTPDGASKTDVTVTYTALEGDDIPGMAPEGTAIGSSVFTLDAGGAKFTQLAQVTIPYTADDVAAAKDGRNDNIDVGLWDDVSGSWIVQPSIPDVLNDTLTVSQNELGTYAILITLPDVLPPTPTPTPPPPTATPDVEDPDTGDIGVSNGMMMALALLGVLFLMGGGYVLARSRNR